MTPHNAGNPSRFPASLRAVALVSALYGTSVGLARLLAAPAMASWAGVAPPSPAVFGDTNGLFLVVVGLGYLLPARDPVRYRGYLWLMGPLLKGSGANGSANSPFRSPAPACRTAVCTWDRALRGRRGRSSRTLEAVSAQAR